MSNPLRIEITDDARAQIAAAAAWWAENRPSPPDRSLKISTAFLVCFPCNPPWVREHAECRCRECGASGRGKRGGVRVIYYLRKIRTEIWMLTIYGKNVRENIPAHLLKQMKEEIDDEKSR